MKKIKILIAIFILSINCIRSQTGTSGDPFTALNQSQTVSSAGVYYFNLGGTTFNTYVDANGYVQVARDSGSATGTLSQFTSLSNSDRGILNATVLASLSNTSEVRISSSTGNVDVISTNATIVSRLVANTTLHRGLVDNGINNSWTGTNASWFTNNATGNSTASTNLHQRIFHPVGNTNTFHWQPFKNQQRELHSSGEVANSTVFQLWVKDNVSPLPIELLAFNTEPLNNDVNITWKTATEINNYYFTIETSIDGIEWQEITRVDGAGNSYSIINYNYIDQDPFLGTSYYRLKQTDFDGQFSYSNISSVTINKSNTQLTNAYPNPTKNNVFIEGEQLNLDKITIYNIFGQEVTRAVSLEKLNEHQVSINLSHLASGTYYIKSGVSTLRINKQ